MVNNSLLQNNSESTANKDMNNAASNESAESREESSNEPKIKKDSEAANDSQPEIRLMDQALQSHVIQSTDDNTTIIHGALADSQAQYIIPLSFKVPKTDKVDTYYNQLSNYLNEDTWGVSDYMFTGTTFQLDKKNNQVHVELPEDFSLQGSTGARMFKKTMTAMFHPYQIKKAVFSQQVNLGPMGNKKELELVPTTAIYKRYQQSEDKREFLVQIPVDYQNSIETALSEMKKDEKPFNVYQSIPTNVDFSIQTDGKLLQLNFADKEMISHNQETVTMIEAILMTAKSFGYQEVRFTNSPYREIGPYNLTNPVEVPEGANPTKIDS